MYLDRYLLIQQTSELILKLFRNRNNCSFAPAFESFNSPHACSCPSHSSTCSPFLLRQMPHLGARWGIPASQPKKPTASTKRKAKSKSSIQAAGSRRAVSKNLADRWGISRPGSSSRPSKPHSTKPALPKLGEDELDEMVGPADESDVQHIGRHSDHCNKEQCARCRQFVFFDESCKWGTDCRLNLFLYRILLVTFGANVFFNAIPTCRNLISHISAVSHLRDRISWLTDLQRRLSLYTILQLEVRFLNFPWFLHPTCFESSMG